jgi:hypothetical protein
MVGFEFVLYYYSTTIIYYIVLNAQQKILVIYIFYDKYILRPLDL